jgi:PEGA domain
VTRRGESGVFRATRRGTAIALDAFDTSEAIVTLTRKLTLAAAAAALLAGPLLPDLAYAQRRGGAVRVTPRRGTVVARAYYRPLFYDPFFYDPFWYPYAYPYRYGWHPPYGGFGYGGGFYDDSASVRLQVTPRETEVFVDGYYAGTADAVVLIDGERWEGPADDEALVVQIAPGAHRIEVSKDGYRSYTGQIDVRAGQTAPINISLPRQ